VADALAFVEILLTKRSSNDLCYKGSGLTDNDLTRIHNKWKNLGLLAKASRL